MRERYAPGLRSVVYLGPDRRDVLYVRDDVEQVMELRMAAVFETLMVDVLGADVNEEAYDHGDLLCVTRRFEEAAELHFPLSAGEGVAVALDGPTLDQFDDPETYLYDVVTSAA